MVEADTVLEVADGVFDHGVAAVVGFELEGVDVDAGAAETLREIREHGEP